MAQPSSPVWRWLLVMRTTAAFSGSSLVVSMVMK